MNNFFKRAMQGDRVVWAIFITLALISIVSMFSASSYLVQTSGSIQGPILRHVQFIAFGVFVIALVQMIEYKWIRAMGYIGFVFSIILLLFTQMYGVEQAGAARFLAIGGFQFQPSEVAKVSLILVIANQIEYLQNEEYQSRYYWIVATAIYITCALIFLENFSTAAILFATTMTMLWIGEIKFKRILITIGIVVAFVAVVLSVAAIIPESVYHESDNKVVKLFARSYTWVARIENFVSPSDEDGNSETKYKVNDSNYQSAHAQIAIARGGWFPGMPGSSQQRNFLPEAFSDFIFAIIVEEGGAIAGFFVILLYLILLYRAGQVARKSESLFGAILVIGVTLLIVFQAFIHIGVNVALGPVTGQPLPLISRGGTSTLVNCFYFGLIINVTRHIQDMAKAKVEAVASTEMPKETETKVAEIKMAETEIAEVVENPEIEIKTNTNTIDTNDNIIISNQAEPQNTDNDDITIEIKNKGDI